LDDYCKIIYLEWETEEQEDNYINSTDATTFLKILNKEIIKVAVNDKFVPWNTVLKPNDTIVFIPPVAGG
ncbi:MAG: MoaD/ThiS family protein, partial [Bacteroidetes bacterium]|nr:MoaD/ThiS family protein [Bacteroidota bacterium]